MIRATRTRRLIWFDVGTRHGRRQRIRGVFGQERIPTGTHENELMVPLHASHANAVAYRSFAARATMVSLLVGMPPVARAQTVTAFAGYAWGHPSAENVHLMTMDLNGWSAGLVTPAWRNVKIIIDADGVYASPVNTGIVIRPNGSVRPVYHIGEAGPRYTFRSRARVTPFVDGVIGLVRAQTTTLGVDFISPVTDTRFLWGADGGARLVLVGPVGIESVVKVPSESTIRSTPATTAADGTNIR